MTDEFSGQIFLKNTKLSNFMKNPFVQWEASWPMRTDGQTDRRRSF